MFRAGGKAWATQFHPEVDAEMAPHWVRDAIQEQKHLGEGFAEQLRTETDDRLPAYPAFCRRITENFVVNAGLCRRTTRDRSGRGAGPRSATATPRTHEGDACASPSCTRFRAAPRGEGLVKGAMGWYLEVPCAGEGCVEGDSAAQTRILPPP